MMLSRKQMKFFLRVKIENYFKFRIIQIYQENKITEDLKLYLKCIKIKKK